MTEKLAIKGQDIWVMIEPHTVVANSGEAAEVFTATYFSIDPATGSSGILLLDSQKKPCTFHSPVAALEYASEKLLDQV